MAGLLMNVDIKGDADILAKDMAASKVELAEALT
jgi:hypothetical protein